LEDEGLKGAWQVVKFTSKNSKISKKQAADSMGKNKKKFKVERIWRPISSDEWKKKPVLSPDLEPDGKWHLLLIPAPNNIYT
tara:strand:- start:8822 stop:9067 length:246 start_codon:yes stop_codon:yes gene_type:complete